MEIREKSFPIGEWAMCGDIIVSYNEEYLLIGWDYHTQQAITIDLKKESNNVRIYKDTDEIREKYKTCRVIPRGEIVLSFK